MVQGEVVRKPRKSTNLIIYMLLIAAIGTYALPMLSIQLPPLGEKTLSVKDVIQSIPKAGGGGEEKKKGDLKVSRDFLDVLMKLLPKDAETKKPVKLSLTFIVGILVPIALVVAYGTLFLSLLIVPFKKIFLSILSGAAVLSAAYAVVGTFYLGLVAEAAYANAVDKVSGKTLGGLVKNFIPEITIVPDYGLYALFLVSAFIYTINLFRKAKKEPLE